MLNISDEHQSADEHQSVKPENKFNRLNRQCDALFASNIASSYLRTSLQLIMNQHFISAEHPGFERGGAASHSLSCAAAMARGAARPCLFAAAVWLPCGRLNGPRPLRAA